MSTKTHIPRTLMNNTLFVKLKAQTFKTIGSAV